jgi:Immunity protein family (Imm11)
MISNSKHGPAFFQLTFDFSESVGIVCTDKDIKQFNVYRLFDGKRIDDWPDGVIFYCEVTQEDDFVLGGLHWKLVSERFQNVFEKNQVQGVQFLPVTIMDRQQRKAYDTYFVLNVFQTVSALNWEEVGYLDIFRQSGRGGTGIYISNRIRQALDKSDSAKGLGYIPVSRKFLGI